jgi:hypothetical protein
VDENDGGEKGGKRDTTHMTDDRGKTSASSPEMSIENIYGRLWD